MSSYDTWLDKQVDDYLNGCKPTPVQIHYEYESDDEYSTELIYNCEGCTEIDCEYYSNFNGM